LDDPAPICSPPALAGQLILVTDYRTNVQGLPLRYPSTNGVLLAMDDPRYSKLAAQVGKMTTDIKQRQAKALSLSRWKFIGVLLLVTLFFPLLLWRRRKSEQTTTKRKELLT
jgi:hypothetical protein